MLGALIIVFREVLEAGLVVGIAFAVTRGVERRGQWIGGGVAAGILAACILAVFVQTIASALDGVGQEVFNFCILATATVMLIWHNAWMALHGKELSVQLVRAGEAVAGHRASLASLGAVVAIAVLREGAEVVLFLYGLAAGGGETMAAMATGGAIGLAAGAATGLATYAGLVALPVKLLFRVTTALIALLAAGMAAQAIGFLEQADLVTQGNPMWDTSDFLSDKSLAGRALHTLVGYVDQPSALQLATYVVVILVNVVLIGFAATRSPARVAAP